MASVLCVSPWNIDIPAKDAKACQGYPRMCRQPALQAGSDVGRFDKSKFYIFSGCNTATGTILCCLLSRIYHAVTTTLCL
jgi:hypothetical protein